MAFLRTVLRCNLSRKYGINFNNILQQNGKLNVSLYQLALRSSIASTQAQTNTTVPGREPLDITFEDSKAAFKSKTTWELYRAYLVYTICSFESIVEHNMKVRIIFKSSAQLHPGPALAVPVQFAKTALLFDQSKCSF